jgi:Asp-tRNA(Asn)/Glu-tRNA(Gln) amidotransferase A subunit family amidase
MGFSVAGLPAGLQITGRGGADSTVLAIGAAFEALHPQHRHPAWV